MDPQDREVFQGRPEKREVPDGVEKWGPSSEYFRKESDANAKLITWQKRGLITAVILLLYLIYRIAIFLTEAHPEKSSYLLKNFLP